MSEQNFNQSMKHFCGESNATGLFMEANYPHANYSISLNTDKNPNIEGTQLKSIMLVRDYNDSSKTSEMKKSQNADNIHNQFVDFVVRTALFHREIDNPTTTESSAVNIRNAIEENTRTLLNDKISTLGSTVDLTALIDSTMWGFDEDRPKNASISLKKLGITAGSSYFEYSNAVLLILIVSMHNSNKRGDVPATINEHDFMTKKTYMPSRDAINKKNLKSGYISSYDVKNAFKYLLGACDNTGKINDSAFGNFCLISTLDTSKGANTNIAKILDDFYRKNGGNKSALMNIINDKLLDAFENYAKKLYKSLGGVTNLYTEYKTSTLADPTDFVKGKFKSVNPSLKLELENEINNSINDAVKKALNEKSLVSYTTLDKNHYAKQLFEDVFINWPNLNPHARNFYRQHLHLFRKVRASSGVTLAEAGWEDIGDRVEDNNFVRNLNPAEVRLNLMKASPGAQETLFEKTLPFVPSKSVTSLWFTNSSGIVEQHAVTSDSFIRDLYNCVYSGNACPIAVPKSYNDPRVKNNVNEFDINDIMVIKDFIKSRKSEPSKSSTMPSMSRPSFDDLLVEDITTRIIYNRDENGLYRIVNGKRQYYDGSDITIDNCAGTQLNGDKAKCAKFVRDCLIHGDTNSLSQCLTGLGDTNMFNVAHKELENVDPNVAVQILRTFGVKQHKVSDPVHGTIGYPQSFEEWKGTVLNNLKPEVKLAIENNHKLCDYLKGVIDFVTANPAILNKNLKDADKVQVVNHSSNDPFLKALKMKMWVDPHLNVTQSKLLESNNLLRSLAYPQHEMSNMLINPYSNVAYSRGFSMSPFGMMSGGASSYEESVMRKIKRDGFTSDLIASIMDSVQSDLKNSGVSLNEADVMRINDGVTEMKKVEKKLFEYYAMLRTLSDLLTFFKSSGHVATTNVKEMSLHDIKNRSDTLAFLNGNIAEVQRCISDNMSSQNSKCQELLGYYQALLGESTKPAVQVSNI